MNNINNIGVGSPVSSSILNAPMNTMALNQISSPMCTPNGLMGGVGGMAGMGGAGPGLIGSGGMSGGMVGLGNSMAGVSLAGGYGGMAGMNSMGGLGSMTSMAMPMGGQMGANLGSTSTGLSGPRGTPTMPGNMAGGLGGMGGMPPSLNMGMGQMGYNSVHGAQVLISSQLPLLNHNSSNRKEATAKQTTNNTLLVICKMTRKLQKKRNDRKHWRWRRHRRNWNKLRQIFTTTIVFV